MVDEKKLQLIYMYSIKEQLQQALQILDSNQPIQVNLLKQQLGFLSDTIILFQNTDTKPPEEPKLETKPELKVVG